ncbi:MAG: DUF4331 family protein [Ignavibacteriae bacterium]|nr:DUF4331 family protein [Ignavibacteria bacterium]MBI3364034.1 DUF4331 family protein [Ignavibacteriota bacterium]
MRRIALFALAAFLVIGLATFLQQQPTTASSHREAPLISNDPLADNTDLYAFRSPDDPNTVTIVANYIPLELPEGGPNYSNFGENVRYEIHIKNRTTATTLGSAKDDITYRFTFTQKNEDPTTFFNIRLGKQNLKTSYKCEKSINGGPFVTIVGNGVVPPNNIGPRSIEGGAGLGTSYDALVASAIATASTGEKVFCGPRDDPFFVDLGGIFDLGQTRSSYGSDPSNSNNVRDAVAGFNTHAIVLKVPINLLQKDGKSVNEAASILDPDFVIGVWASASRQKISVMREKGKGFQTNGPWMQVSRLGMPLTNEAIIPLEDKDYWNAVSPYSADEQEFVHYFANPELALYMDDSQFGGAVPGLSPLRVQSQSYPAIGVLPGYTTAGFDFRNGKDGAFAATHIPGLDVSGTAFAVPVQPGLLGPAQPRLVDIFPIFYFGVPNAIPYQLATGKTGGPLSAGKPFIHNFLPITNDAGKLYGGDLLRLNMATPATPRGTEEYSMNARMGLIRAAAIGLTAAPFNTNKNLEAIPHMDGFPNGRRLEDDVTTIELQAVGGLVLAAVGLPFDDAAAGNYSDLASPKLVAELTYNAGPTKNDVPLLSSFPYLAPPHRGYDYVKRLTASAPGAMPKTVQSGFLGMSAPEAFLLEQNYPNPFNPSTEIKYHLSKADVVKLRVYNTVGQEVASLVDQEQAPGTYSATWSPSNVATGTYYYSLQVGDKVVSVKKALYVK